MQKGKNKCFEMLDLIEGGNILTNLNIKGKCWLRLEWQKHNPAAVLAEK